MQNQTAEHIIKSKLPEVETSIFTIMSKMANEHNAINLSQGFPDFPVAEELIDRIHYYMKKGYNQYAPTPGTAALINAIAAKMERCFNFRPQDPTQEITITAGATEGLFCVIAALIHAGDEVIVLDPAYDAYVPTVELQGGKAVRIPLKNENFRPDWTKIKEKVTSKTRLVIFNTPHNPSGAVLQEEDMMELQALLQKHEQLWVLSDEVYEHITFDGEQHQSILRYPDIRKRGAAVFSFGKTFHATGWKTGYVVASPALMKEIRNIHQFVTFAVHTPTQLAIADYLSDPAHYEQLPHFYQQKRDTFAKLMEGSRFKPIPCSGTYFQLYSYAAISDKADTEMAEWLTKEHGVANIPVSVFYESRRDQQLLRFCFAKNEDTLQQAAKILCKI